MLEEISRSIEGHTVCALGDAAAWPVQGASQPTHHHHHHLRLLLINNDGWIDES